MKIKKFLFFIFFIPFFLVFRDRVSLYCFRAGPETHSVDQDGLKIRDLPASASQGLGLKAGTANARLNDVSCIKKRGDFYKNFVMKGWWLFEEGFFRI